MSHYNKLIFNKIDIKFDEMIYNLKLTKPIKK
jgi:hypothetical protein